MQYTFNVETKRNVNVVGDYSVISYDAEYIGEEGLPSRTYRGTVRVAPHDADPDDEIGRDILEQITRQRRTTDSTLTVTVEE